MNPSLISILSDLLNELNRIETTCDISVIVKSLILSHGYPITDLGLYIYDVSAEALRDLNDNRNTLDRSSNQVIYDLYKKMSDYDLTVNGKFFKLNSVPSNVVIKVRDADFPIYRNDELYGLVTIKFADNFETDALLLTVLRILVSQISLKIQNIILTEQTEVNIDFHESMKNIAKIIETQYELNYIIPIIGEMLDKFISLHLIYVFLKEAEGYRLVWPKDCRDNQINTMLRELTTENGMFLSRDGTRGVFALKSETEIIGAVAAFGITESLTSREISYLEQLSNQASITINRANTYAETLKHATLDALTGLNNRRQFEMRLRQEISVSNRQKNHLCAMMIDIDFFKTINDRYGHYVGDKALQEISKIIKTELRESDIPSRYGGEEFSVILPNTRIDEAYLVAERLRKSVESDMISVFNENSEQTERLKISVSIGLAEYELGSDFGMLFKNADKALYVAKKQGRNRVIKYEE